MRVPTVRRGQRLTASLWNTLAGAVNEAIAAPRDLDAGITDGEAAMVVEREVARTEVEVRVKNPDNEDQFVDVERVTSITVRGSDGITRQILYNDT